MPRICSATASSVAVRPSRATSVSTAVRLIIRSSVSCGEAHGAGLLGRELGAEPRALAAQQVLVFVAGIRPGEIFTSPTVATVVSDGAREDVGDAPDAEAEGQNPQENGGDPGSGEFAHLLKHDEFRTWR